MLGLLYLIFRDLLTHLSLKTSLLSVSGCLVTAKTATQARSCSVPSMSDILNLQLYFVMDVDRAILTSFAQR